MTNKKRLIDANTIPYRSRNVCGGHGLYYDETIAYKEDIDALPTADAVEVVHGKWEYGRWEKGHWVKGNERCRCSVCHRDFAVDNLNIWNGCPHCLAKMDGDGNA